jgi:acetyltransferase-like isoleucine patch superfamily enzyme
MLSDYYIRCFLLFLKYIGIDPRKHLQEILLKDPLIWGDPNRIKIAKSAIINNALLNVSSGEIIIGEYVFFGHNVCIITGTHDYNQFGLDRMRATPLNGHDIIIEDGVWLATNVTVIGPCRIGRNAVVAAGAVVTHDVADYEIVGGIPARHLGEIIKKI